MASKPLLRSFRSQLLVNLVACLLLVVQFVLGMVVNLYVAIPARHPGANAHNFFAGVASAIAWAIPDGPLWLALHVGFGLALVTAGLANAWLGRTWGGRVYAIASTLGALTVLGAAFNGASFVDYGHDFSSMIMAGLWAVSLCCYLTCFYLVARSGLGVLNPATAALTGDEVGQIRNQAIDGCE